MSHSWAQINLDALAANHDLITQKIGSNAKLLAVVKANAYGHGVDPVSKTLYDLGVRWFGVASVAEGCQLRAYLPDADILVLGCVLPDEIPDLLEAKLVVTVSSLAFAEELNARSHRKGARTRVHLKIDTGMGRLGFHPRELEQCLAGVSRMQHLVVEGMCSHFSSADEEDLTPSHGQLQTFLAAITYAQSAGLPLTWFHIANSSGVFRVPDSQFTLVRCGLFLYGLYPDTQYTGDIGLQPVLEWKTRVGLIKEVPPGYTISYGRTHTIREHTKIAILPVGYADGYNRALSNRGKVLIQGQFAPVLGRVTMDHIVVDIGGIPDAREGDEVVLIGRQGQQCIRAEDMASWLGTISYEVVCSLGQRVARKTVSRAASAPSDSSLVPAAQECRK